MIKGCKLETARWKSRWVVVWELARGSRALSKHLLSRHLHSFRCSLTPAFGF